MCPGFLTPLFLLFIGAILFFIPAPAAEAQGPARYGGTLVLASTSDPKTFNDIVAQETSSSAVTGLIFEGLTRTNAVTLEVEPFLASRWDISDDGREWTFHLREDVVWNDGVQFTADDVVFTFNDLIYNDDIPSSSRDIFTIDGQRFDIRKIDKFTVQFLLPVRFAPLLRSLSQSILPRHKLIKAVKDGTFSSAWGIDTDPAQIIGTGPFRLVEYLPGERVIFKRNPLYWKISPEGDPLPYLETIIHIIVQNEDIAVLKFLDGELDYTSLRGMDYPLLKPLETRQNFTIYETGPNFGSNFITFNQNRGLNPRTGLPVVDPVKLSWFTDLNFRRAVAHAIDRRKIIAILMNGLGYPQDSPVSPAAGFYYNPDVVKYPYDLKKAASILAEAGYRDRDGDGILRDPRGHPVEFNLLTNAGAQVRVQIASIIRRDLEGLGMKVNFSAIEFNDLVAKLNATYQWDAVLIGLTGGIEPHFGKNVWSSSGSLHLWYPRQETAASDWEKRIDAIFTEGAMELDENARKVLYDEFQMIVSRQVPVVYTVLGSNIFAVRNRFGNLNPTSTGGAFHNIEEIYWKDD